jgi:hypothetical protein
VRLKIDRPIPDETAKRGLQHVQAVTVEFSGGTERQQDAALEHLDELIEFWNLKSVQWLPLKKRDG